MITFPRDFFWGAAAAAHQVEGENVHSDWWHWEQSGGGKAPSAQACRHYELYERDFDIAASLNHNCHRLSVEWARIQPEQDRFSGEALEHYSKVIDALRARSLEPIVTLHHFTSPQWFAAQGGWSNPASIEQFACYARKVCDVLANKVRYWVTINEPLVYDYYSYISGDWPPCQRSLSKAKMVRDNFILAHIKTYRYFHDEYRKRGLKPPLLSVAHHLTWFEPCFNTLQNRLAALLKHRLFNLGFLDALASARTLDYIGVNYYSRHKIEAKGWGLKGLLLDSQCHLDHSSIQKNDLGWDVYPQGLYRLLLGLKRYRLPVIILENGFCGDDRRRWDFIREHLKAAYQALREGVDLRGYVYWSLIDNFEWDKGFAPRFGLVEVDYSTYARIPRPSALAFAQVCKTGLLKDEGI